MGSFACEGKAVFPSLCSLTEPGCVEAQRAARGKLISVAFPCQRDGILGKQPILQNAVAQGFLVQQLPSELQSVFLSKQSEQPALVSVGRAV